MCVFVSVDSAAMGAQELPPVWGPSAGAQSGPTISSEVQLRSRIRERNFFSLTVSSTKPRPHCGAHKTTPLLALTETNKELLLKQTSKYIKELLLFDIQTSAIYFHSF